MSRWQWRRSVESAWFYAAWFCLFAAAVLFVAPRKYGERQSGIERRFQARTQPLGPSDGGQGRAGEEIAEAYYSSPKSTIIPLWPLAVMMIGMASVFGILAFRAGMPSESDKTVAN